MNHPKRILLVEDDPAMRAMVAAFLGSTDCEITEADNVSVAMHELSNGKSFDVVIVDFWLGKNHAVSVMDLIASQSGSLPVIVISGGNGKMDLEKTEAISDVSGAIAFLQKPFRQADLIEVVTSLTK